MISNKVRAAEADIDDRIRQLPIWNCNKSLLLKALMELWRDGLELAYMRFGHAVMFQSSESFEAAKAIEHQVNTGVYWCLKWAYEYALESSTAQPAVEELVDTVMHVGAPYLRAAVLNDRDQYERTSGRREERMIAICKPAFEAAGWKFQPHLILKNPSREIDGYAAKDRQDVVIQLKSTLRPHSPFEVHKRNSDVIEGIKHTADVLPRFREGALGFVVTDGYKGDYLTWRESLATRVPIATLQDLSMIAADPAGAFQTLAKRADIDGDPGHEPVPARVVDLCGWTIRLIDSDKPK